MSRMVEPIPKSKPAGKSARKRLFDREFEAAKAVVAERSRGWCEFPDCTRWARIFHHRKGRLAKNSNAPEMLAHLCVPCHDRTHSHVAESYRNGMLVRRGS